MQKTKCYLAALVSGVLLVTGILAGCGQSKKDDHLTVYLWENRLMKNIAPYIHEQFPDQDIEFIIGNNDTDLYSYFKEHGELPDIMTVRRFSGTDAQDLQPYLMDFASYDVVSKYYSYAVEYYRDTDGEIQWLPICAIPQTIIANKTLFDQYGIKVPENYEEYVQVCQQFYDKAYCFLVFFQHIIYCLFFYNINQHRIVAFYRTISQIIRLIFLQKFYSLFSFRNLFIQRIKLFFCYSMITFQMFQ